MSGLVIATPDGGSVAASEVIGNESGSTAEAQTTERAEATQGEAPQGAQATEQPTQSATAESQVTPEQAERGPAPDGYVPKGALFEERQKRRQIENTFAPIAQALQANPDLVAELESRMRGGGKKPAPTQAPADDFTEQEIMEAARDFALYQPDGTVDVNAAKNALRRIDERTRAAVDRALQPVNQRFQNDAVSVARHRMASMAQAEGINPQVADQLLMTVAAADPSLVQHESVLNVVAMVAEGIQKREGIAVATTPATTQPKTPPIAEVKVKGQTAPNFRAPVMTENGTGRASGPVNEVPRFMANAMRKAGLKPSADAMARADQAFAAGGPMVFTQGDE